MSDQNRIHAGNISSYFSMINKEGYIFISLGMASCILFSGVSTTLSWISFMLTILLVYFFRDPIRCIPQLEDFILSPADGVIVDISENAVPPVELGITHSMKKISIFLSPLDVHINRIPIKSLVVKTVYHPGKFFNASLDKASEYNERHSNLLELVNSNKDQIAVIQIAGMIARRVVCNLKVNQEVKAGEKFGIIKFSSRVDIYLPVNFPVFVHKGQTCVAGETIFASSDETLKHIPITNSVIKI